MADWLLFLLLLPAAMGLGWHLARRKDRRKDDVQSNRLSKRYFRGLNYLLNEQPDKAIEVFLKLAEVNQDTVETHFALGSLFRRRGEVDRAIRFHQNIIAKPTLSDHQRTRALLELGEDYMRAGLLDRAERLFSELVERDDEVPSALRHLQDIYQQEKDWEKAIEIARKREQGSGRMGPIIAHYFCEMADQSAAGGQHEVARKHLRQARRYFTGSVRARLIEAGMAEQAQDYPAAVAAYQSAVELGPEYLPEVLQSLLQCMHAAGQSEQLETVLREYAEKQRGISPVLALSRVIEKQQGADAAASYLVEQLHRRPSVLGLQQLVRLKASNLATGTGEDLKLIEDIVHKILKDKNIYRCDNCGFGGHQHHWQCPSCKQWDSTKRIRGVTGE